MARPNGATRLASLGVRPHARAAPPAPPASDALLEALLAGIPDGVVLCDRFLAPVRASASAAWLLAPDGGWADSRAAGACREAAAAALDRGGVATVEVGDGGERWEARAAPLGAQDAQVCVSVRPAVGALREAVLRAAHDLKAPLHAAGAYATLLLREAAGPLTPAQRQMVETIDTEAGRLRAQLEGVLERVRTGDAGDDRRPTTGDGWRGGRRTAPPPAERPIGGRDARAPGPTPDQGLAAGCDLQGVLERVVERLAGAAALRGVRLEPVGDRGPVAAALPEADARTILENLVANALAAVPAGGTVGAAAEPLEGGVVRCRVWDDGPGIPEQLHERIFEPHFRIPEHGGRGGTGLGLAISRALAERSGGTLTVANRVPGGAVFTLTAPAARPEAGARLRLAPVTSHQALAHVQRALDGACGRAWRLLAWEEGAVTVEAEDAERAAARVGARLSAGGVVCWAV